MRFLQRQDMYRIMSIAIPTEAAGAHWSRQERAFPATWSHKTGSRGAEKKRMLVLSRTLDASEPCLLRLSLMAAWCCLSGAIYTIEMLPGTANACRVRQSRPLNRLAS